MARILSYIGTSTYKPEELRSQEENTVYLQNSVRRGRHHKRKGEILKIEFEELEKNVSSKGRDLVRTSLVMFSSERLDTSTNQDVSPDQREESFSELRIPCSEPDLWRKQENLLRSMYLFLTEKNTSLKFSPHHTRLKKIRDVQRKGKADCVVLFSGGLDSLAAYYWAKKSFQNPIFVNVCTDEKVQRYIKGIKENLLPKINLYSLNLVNRLPSLQNTLLQTRAFVFVATAAMIAEVYDCKKILVGETGPIMFQPKFFSTDIVTRTTHPILLELSKKLFDRIYNKEFTILTPFKDSTKAEMIFMLPSSIKNSEMSRFDSCLNTHVKAMCGSCYSCIVRRLSSIVAGAKENENSFDDSVFKDDNPKKLSHLVPLLEFCFKVVNDFNDLPQDIIQQIDDYHNRYLFNRFAEDMLAGVYLIRKTESNVNEYLKRFSSELFTDKLIVRFEKRIQYVRSLSQFHEMSSKQNVNHLQ